MLTDIQQKLLQMMKEIDAICQENDIHYTLGGGTAIGAIRHGGFIPWDDDIDLYMTRDNWEKFKVAEKEGKFPKNRVLESPETDPEYSNTFGRYVTTDSTAIHSHQVVSNDAAGHVLDVFVFDPIHIDNFWKYMEDYQLLSDLMNETIGYSSRFDMNIDRYQKYYRRTQKEGKKVVIDELLNNMIHLNSPGWKHYIMEWGTAPFVFPSSIFDGGYTRIPFEDTTVEIVKNFSEYLTWQYGDEWQYIPQHDGREGHDAIFSSKIPYSVAKIDYLQFIDADNLHKAYVSRKYRLMKANRHRRNSQIASLKTAGEECIAKLTVELESKQLSTNNLKKMLLEKKYDELSTLFTPYYDLQLSADFSGRKDKHSTLHRYYNPVRINIDDELFGIAVEVLIRTERMSKAMRLIELFEGFNGEVEMLQGVRDNEVIENLKEEILCARALINDYSKDRNSLLYDRVNKYLEKYPDNSQIARIKIRMLLETPSLEKDGLTAASKCIDQLLEDANIISPELKKYRYDIVTYGRKLTTNDIEKYQELYDETNNGYIKLEIEELLKRNGVIVKKTEEDESKSVLINRKAKDYSSKLSLYRIAKNLYIKIASKDDKAKDDAWNIACRTRDRIELLDAYEDKLADLQELKNNNKWDELESEMKIHQEAVIKNLELGLGLCVHPLLNDIQKELFIRQGKKDIASRLDALIPEEHKKPIWE